MKKDEKRAWLPVHGIGRFVAVLAVLGALLTTPEVITQVIMFLPLQLLYEVSVWIAWYWERKEKKREAEG